MTAVARPTLLVFTLGENVERRRRRLLPASRGDAETALHRALLTSAIAAGAAAGLRCVVAAPVGTPLPAGIERVVQPLCGSFGERLAASVAAARPGAAPLVIVGSDVPGLGEAQLRAALAALARDPDAVVVGPSPDGGCYLVAASRPLAMAFAATRWRSKRTLSSLRRALAAEGCRVVLLPPLADLDRRTDLDSWLATSPAAEPLGILPVRRWLRRLLSTTRHPVPSSSAPNTDHPLLGPHAARPPPRPAA